MAWQIVRHAFQMVFGNLVEALKVSVFPSVMLLVALGVASAVGGMTGQLAVALVLTAIPTLFVMSWIFVGWHRFVLLEEYPEIVPAVQAEPVKGYMIGSLKVGGVMVLTGGLGFIIVQAIGTAMAALNAMFLLGIMMLAILIGLGVLSLRLGLCLPAAAIGRKMTLSESLAATAPLSGVIVQIAIMTFGLAFLGSMFTNILISGGMGLIAAAFEVAIFWVTMMVNASVLTTLYGIIIEGRQLND